MTPLGEEPRFPEAFHAYEAWGPWKWPSGRQRRAMLSTPLEDVLERRTFSGDEFYLDHAARLNGVDAVYVARFELVSVVPYAIRET